MIHCIRRSKRRHARWLTLALGVAAHLGVLPLRAEAQAREPNKRIRDTTGPIRVRLVRGDIVLVEADSAFAYNRPAELVSREILRLKDSTIARLRARVAVSDSIDTLRQAVVRGLRGIDSIQTLAYDTLRERFAHADTLARRSVANTNAALAYARRVKGASLMAGGLVGGLVGGFGIKTSGQEGFNWWPGFAVGAAVGFAVNWLVLRLIR